MVELTFPEGFLWGAATSAHQVEGHNVHNDWWAWEQAGRVKTSSGLACDHYRRYPEDFDLAVQLSHTAHRFSIEWSRIEPADGQWNEEALAHYVEVVRALRSRHLEPLVTLHHFTTPQWLARRGGWANPIVVDRFARYTERVAQALGDLVRYWITINEPMVYVNMHYVEGIGPPGGRDFKQALPVIRHLIEAHAASYHILHQRTSSQGAVRVSVAKHLPSFMPCHRWWPLDRLAATMTDRLFNVAFLEALTDGVWSVPGVGTWRIPDARQTLDFLGVNFYGRQFMRGGLWPLQQVSQRCRVDDHPHHIPERSEMGWDVDPEPFFEMLRRWGGWGLPIVVTENGTWMKDDARRWRYIAGHLQAIARAIEAGTRVIGYCYWSLIDNFEWAHGFGPRFGLIEMDYATQRRRIRESAWQYAEVCRANRLTF